MKLHHFNPKKQKHGLLYQVFVVVAVIQIALLVAFSSYVVSQSMIEEQKFEAPPTIEKVEQAQKEHKVRVERQQKKATKMNRRISIANPQNVNAPAIKVTLPPAFVQGGGISPISDKVMSGNMKITMTTVDIGGIKSKTEKVLICIDAGPYLMTEERGGLDTYKVIREDIKRLVNNLPPTVLFNLMAFDISYGASITFFQSNLVAATSFNKRSACDWIEPINATLTTKGVSGPRYKLKYPFLPQPPQSGNYSPYISNIYRVYQAALEQGADTIYLLTTRGNSRGSTALVDPESIKMPWTDAQIESYRRAMESYDKLRARALKQAGWTDEKQQEYESAQALARQAGIKKARDWIKSENAKRQSKGVSLYTGTPEQAMRENKFYVDPTPRPPAVKVKRPEVKFKSYGRTGLFRYYMPLFKEVYLDKKMKPPTLHMILFMGEKEDLTPTEKKFVRSFTAANNGGRTRTLKGIKSVNDIEQQKQKQ